MSLVHEPTIHSASHSGKSAAPAFDMDRLIPVAAQAEFDCLVMFSGGKDSTFLLYQLHHVYKRRVMAFSIDTGFEAKGFLDHVADLAEKIDVPWTLLKPPKSTLAAFYRVLIANTLKLNTYSKQDNIMCHICGYVVQVLSRHYAVQRGIPVVASGLNKDQLGMVRMSHDEVQLEIALRMYEYRHHQTYAVWQTLSEYNENPALRALIDRAYHSPGQVKMVYPFLFMPYDLKSIIKCLVNEIGWRPPNNLKPEEYITSGCRLFRILPYLMRIRLVGGIQELNEIRDQVKRGELNEHHYKKAISLLAEYEAKTLEELRPTDLLHELGWQADELEKIQARTPLFGHTRAEPGGSERQRGEI